MLESYLAKHLFHLRQRKLDGVKSFVSATTLPAIFLLLMPTFTSPLPTEQLSHPLDLI
ncbi:hypothetical protein Hanom_Chr11g00980611 [Helianthus anomalus]